MNRPRRRLRTRLLVAMVGIAFGVLVVSTLGAIGLAKRTAADSTLNDVRDRAPELATTVDDLGTQIREQPLVARAANRFKTTLVELLAQSGTSVFTINDDGTVTRGASGLIGEASSGPSSTLLDLPEDMKLRDLDLVDLVAGQQLSGIDSDRAYVAVPLSPVAGATPVVVVTQQVEQRPLGRAGTFLIITGGLALLAAVLVSAVLARRLTRPLTDMEQAANRIAGGDLSARVDATDLPDDELAGLTRSFNAMATELETARGHERAFLLSVSHDLRTPLTSIKGYAEAITDGTITGTDDSVRAARVIETEARRLERLVADLLDLARLDAHQFSLTPRPIDAREVVETTVAGFEPSARDFAVALRIQPGDAAPADADPERLAQIVANLVENALKYASTAVSITVSRAEDVLTVYVDDDGPGIPADEHQRVFERLYTARPAAGRPVGTGIGLAIVHELATAMGGDARSETLDTGGARFTVTLPT